MSKKTNKKDKRIVKDMKDCLQSFYLPVQDVMPANAGQSKIMLQSGIHNDRVSAGVSVTYEKEKGYVEIDIFSFLKVPTERFTDVIRLLDVFNGKLAFENYFIWPKVDLVSLRGVVFVPEAGLPKAKFKRLVVNMLEHIYLGIPPILGVIIGGKLDDAVIRFEEECNAKKEKRDGMSDESIRTILHDMESVITHLGLSVQEEDRFDNGFGVYFSAPDQPDVDLGAIVELDEDGAMVILDMFPLFAIPDEKISSMAESVHWLNLGLQFGCMYVDREEKLVRFRKVIMVENNTLDKEEFMHAAKLVLGLGCRLLSYIHEQISSDVSIEAAVEKVTGKWKGEH